MHTFYSLHIKGTHTIIIKTVTDTILCAITASDCMKWCCYYNHPLSSGGWHFPFEEQLLKHTSSMLTCMVSIRDGESRPTSATYQFPASTERNH